ELLAELGQRHLSGVALEQHAAERFLHLLDLHRQGRLRDRAGFRRAAEVGMTGERVEVAKLAERDVDHKIILLQQSLKSISSDRTPCVDCPHPAQAQIKITQGGNMDDVTKCPFTGRTGAPSNRTWWPKQLDISVLHANSPLSDPMGKEFDYAK